MARPVDDDNLDEAQKSWRVYAAAMIDRTAMSGTDRAYGRIWLRACYALCDRSDGHQVPVCLRACYAMSGTEIAYAAICLRALCDVRY
eukprot:3628717-Rhodomonas_salina.2